MIPYIIVLIFVGKPIYFLEMVMGQFSSRGSVKGATHLHLHLKFSSIFIFQFKVFDCAPAMRGVGVGQVVSVAIVATYYSSLMALTLNYFAVSFNSILPWRDCKPEWGDCIPSTAQSANMTWSNNTKSSAELYFM